MNDFKIDSDIPIPIKGKYPFAGMEVGDSFFVPDDSILRVRAAMQYYNKKLNAEFEARMTEHGLRIWRTG